MNACLQIQTDTGNFYFGKGITPDSIEAKLLQAASGKGRIIGKSRRVFFSSGSMMLLVKNMPVDDLNRNGRLRDNILVLLNSAEGVAQKLHHMQRSELHRKQNKGMALDVCHEEMLLAKEEIQYMTEEVEDMLNRINMKFEESLISLGLSDDQERFIQSLLGEGYKSLKNLQQMEEDIVSSFNNITNKIKRMI